MSLLLLAAMAYLTGIVLFFAAAPAARLLPGERRESVANFYFDLGTSLYGRLLLVVREAGQLTFELVQATPSYYGTLKTSLDGDTKNFEDPDGLMKRLNKNPFGLADEKYGTVFTPRHAEVAEKAKQAAEQGLTISDGQQTYVNGVLDIPTDDSRLVDPRYIRAVATGSARATLAERIEELTAKSQAFFDTHPKAQYIVWLGGLTAGFGMMLVAYQFISTTGGSTSGRGIGIPIITLLTGMIL